MSSWIVAILGAPFLATVLRIGLIVLLTLAAFRGLRLAVLRVERRLEKTVTGPERLARLKTLVQVGQDATLAVILLVTGLMALQSLGINITPVLAGASVAGLALSLGAQTLIKDFIGGILILIENQFSVGDVIAVGDVSGAVERITLRSTCLREFGGTLHIVANGDMRLVSNTTKDWVRAIVVLDVDFEADMNKVIGALKSAAQKAQADETIQGDLLEPPGASGWIGFSDWAVQVRLSAKTKPGKDGDVAMALRRYAVEALQAEDIKVAIPAQKINLER